MQPDVLHERRSAARCSKKKIGSVLMSPPPHQRRVGSIFRSPRGAFSLKLDSIRIQNLRSCKDVTVTLNPYTCLVGPNGAGKSTVLTALNIFFRELQNAGSDLSRLVEEDFHQKDTSQPIAITLTFTDLSQEAQTDFAAYYRDDKLIITAEAVFDEASQRAEVKQYGERMVMPEFAKFFAVEADGGKVAELKAIYAEIR